MNYVSIASYSSRLEAETFGYALESQGIPFIVKCDDAGIAGFAGGHFGATLWVPEDLADQARRALPCTFPKEDGDDEPLWEPVRE